MIKFILITSFIFLISNLYSQSDTAYLKVKFSNNLNTENKVLINKDVTKILERANSYTLKKSFPNSPFESHQCTFDITVIGNIDEIINELKQDVNVISVSRYKLTSPLIECVEPININDYEVVVNSPAECYQLELCDFYCAWSITKGNSNRVVALADSDFDIDHEDLDGQFSHIEGPVSNYHYHGTVTSSMAGARVNNSIGIAGGGYNCKVAGYRVNHYASGYAWGGDVKNAIWAAYLNGEKIISCSYGDNGLDATDATNLTNAGVTLIVSAGNDTLATNNHDIADVPGVINVSGVNNENKHRPTHHAQNAWVDLCAPSTEILCCYPWNPYQKYLKAWGTSIAAPQVAATCALIQSVNQCLSPGETENIIKSTTDPIVDGYLYPGLLGTGKLNAYNAVMEAIEVQTLHYDGNLTGTYTYLSGMYLTSNGIVKSGANITFQAGRDITLDYGFEVEIGGQLTTGSITATCN